MPTYIYRCSHCKHEFEKVQKFTDAPIDRCPNCRRKGVRKVLTPPPIQFKGSGWYVTDSKGSSSTKTTSKSSKKKETGTGSTSGEAAAHSGKSESESSD